MNNIMEKNLSFGGRELKAGPASFDFSSSVTGISNDGGLHSVDTNDSDKSVIFFQNYKYWNKETGFSSTNNLDNSYFQEIVNMGIDAVPYIIKELKVKPSPLVHALERIFPGVVSYDGFVSLKDACDKWLSILQ